MNIDKLRELALAATEGPWEVYTQKQWDSGIDFFGAKPGAFMFPIDCEPQDAEYIAEANPTAILELLDALKEIGEWANSSDMTGTTILAQKRLKAILDKL